MKHFFACAFGVLLSAFPAVVYAQESISPTATRQIESLIQEKESRTPIQKKMGSQLWYALKMERKQSITPLVPTLDVETIKDAQGLVAVDIISATTSIDPILDFVKRVNGRIQSAHSRFRSVLAYIPILEAENLATLREVHFAELWVKPQNNSKHSTATESSPKAGAWLEKGILQNGSGTVPSILAGAIVSEADETHLVSSTRAMYGVNGAGVKIGVLSDSYNSLGTAATDVTQGELPGVGNPAGFTTPVTVLTDVTSGSDEGRAMLQLIHDLVPGAQLYYASAFNGDADFAQQILNLRAAGCDIIVDDVSYFNEPVFQDGVIARAVNTVTASGASYFSSAGNSGNKNDNTSGVWEGDFKDGGTNALLAGGNVLDFATGVLNNALTVAGRPYLKWSDPQGLSGNDYDLFSLNSTGTSVLASSTNVQDGNDDPIESLASQSLGRRLVIFKKTGAAVRALHLNTNRGRLTVGTNGVTGGHNAGKSTICVAATPALAAYPNAHTTSNVTETFSSDGPRRIFYNPDTTAITPGNVLFATNGGEKLQKPDLTAADGTKTSVSGFSAFFGTSAAAPHAAAIAALLKSKTPSLTNTQIYNALIASALDIEAPGSDENSGVGIIMANTAMSASGATPLFADLGKIGHSLIEGSFSNGNGSIEPGEVAQLKIRLRNRSTLIAQNVVAILTSSQAGVKIFRNKWELNSLAGTTDTSNNLLPYLVGIPSSLACGSNLFLTLKLAYQGSVTDTTFIPLNFTLGSQPFLNIATSLGQAPASVANVVTSSGTITSRISRNGISGSCAVPKSNPGTAAVTGSPTYHSYTFTNSSGVSQCVSVNQSSLVSFTNLYSAVYNNSGFLPGSVSTNFLADLGSSSNGSYSFTVNPGQQFTAVVNEISQGAATGVPYNLSVSLATCAPSPNCSAIQAAITNVCAQTGEAINFQPLIIGGSGFYTSQVITTMPAGLNFSNGVFTGNVAIAGLQTVVIQYNDEMGCPASELEYSFHITDPVHATASDDTLCAGESVVLQGSPVALPGMTYTWSDGVQNGVAFVPSSTRIYTLISTFGPCILTDSIQVVVNPVPSQPLITAFGPTTFCEGDSVILQSSSATGNLWSNGSTNRSVLVSASQILSVRVVAGTCTSAVSNTVEVVVNPVPPTPSILTSGATSFCEGGSVVLQSGSPTGNVWNNGASSQEILVSQSGEFSVRTIAAGCSSAVSAIVSVVVNPNPTVSAGTDQTINLGQSASLTATGADQYQWSPLAGLIPSNGTGASVLASPVNTTLYFVTGTTANGCVDTDSVLVTVNPVLLPLTPPLISPGTGSYTGPLTVTITGIAGANLYYTTNGNIPRVDVPNGFTKLYTGPFQVTSNTTVRAIAVRGSEVSLVRAVFLTVSNPTVCDPPVIQPGTGNYTSIQIVTMSTATAGAEIWYTTNGNLPLFTTPNSFTKKYTGAFQVDRTTTINAVTIKTGVQNSANSRVILTINLAQSIGPVVFSPAPGLYPSSVSVSMSNIVADAQIYYTTNGNTPRTDVFNYFTKLYSTPVAISSNTTLKAMGIKSGLVNGPVTTGIYSFGPARMATQEPELGMFPNPARDRIYLNLVSEGESEGRVEIFDLQGRRLSQNTIQADGSQLEMDVRNLPAGNYLVKVQTGTRMISRLLVKE